MTNAPKTTIETLTSRDSLLAANPLIQDKIPEIPTEDITWLAARIAAFWARPESEDLDYVDNGRLAIKGDPRSEGVYDDQRNDGCCGSRDVEFGPSPSGKAYLYGFNFGH